MTLCAFLLHLFCFRKMRWPFYPLLFFNTKNSAVRAKLAVSFCLITNLITRTDNEIIVRDGDTRVIKFNENLGLRISKIMVVHPFFTTNATFLMSWYFFTSEEERSLFCVWLILLHHCMYTQHHHHLLCCYRDDRKTNKTLIIFETVT